MINLSSSKSCGTTMQSIMYINTRSMIAVLLVDTGIVLPRTVLQLNLVTPLAILSLLRILLALYTLWAQLVISKILARAIIRWKVVPTTAVRGLPEAGADRIGTVIRTVLLLMVALMVPVQMLVVTVIGIPGTVYKL